MKPIVLLGHERAITQICYNREGDLLFSCAKDTHPNVWYSTNGERLGTFQGHSGAVWCIDVSWDTSKVLTGAADSSCRLWDCETGKELHCLKTRSPVRSCGFSFSGNLIMLTTDEAMKQPCELQMYDIRDPEQIQGDSPAVQQVSPDRISSAVWSHLDDYIISGHNSGSLTKWDMRAPDEVEIEKSISGRSGQGAHDGVILDLHMSNNQALLVSASKDHTAKVWSADNLELIKTIKDDRPCNSASISSYKHHIVMGGGQEARDVTVTSAQAGKFDAKFFHWIFEEEIGKVKDHFGPINSVRFHPDGKSYSSGGEDGYVRVHYFDHDYFDYDLQFGGFDN